MAYDFALPNDVAAPIAAAPAPALRTTFERYERIMVLIGGMSAGAIVGGALAIGAGRLGVPVSIAIAAPLLIASLVLAAHTLSEALSRNARGCAAASIIFAAGVLAWPFTSLFIPLGAANYLIAPVLAFGGLALFASCWTGPSRAVYRMGVQGLLVALVAAHQGLGVLMS